MNCNEFLTQLHDCFMGKLPVERALLVDAHAAGCAECGSLMARAKELSCREFTEFLNAYVADELPAARRAVFERHVGLCEDCRNYLSSYRETMRLCALSLADGKPLLQPVPEDLILAVLRAISKEKG